MNIVKESLPAVGRLLSSWIERNLQGVGKEVSTRGSKTVHKAWMLTTVFSSAWPVKRKSPRECEDFANNPMDHGVSSRGPFLERAT
jgi:hypothetical protein